MAYLVDPHTIYSGLKAVGMTDDAKAFKALIEEVLQGAARKLADKVGFGIGEAHLEEAEFGGLLIQATPREEGDPIPEVLKGADAEDEWPID